MIIRRKLRDYQVKALEYTRHWKHPALFLQMRLGKTVITIRRLRELKANRILIVAPNSALGSWKDELILEQELDVVELQGTRIQRLRLLFNNVMYPKTTRVWYLVNKEAHLAIPELADVKWDAVVLDESVFIANPNSKVSKFFTKNFRDVASRWVLCGMPNPESDAQLVQQMIWLDRQYLGFRTFWHFRAKMCEPDERRRNYQPTMESRKIMAKELHKKAFVLSWRDAGLKVKKIREIRYLDLPKELITTYRQVERDFILEYAGQELGRTIWSLTSYTWLRRIAGGFVTQRSILKNDWTPSLVWPGKIKEVLDLLKGELSQERCVIWFVFNAELEAMSAALSKSGISHHTLTGAICLDERERRRHIFQDGGVRVLCLQVAVAQTGMNLSKAGGAIYFSEPLGLLSRQQTEDRTINVADERGKLYVHLLTRNTVDVDIHTANNAKALNSSLTLSATLLNSIRARSQQ